MIELLAVAAFLLVFMVIAVACERVGILWVLGGLLVAITVGGALGL